MSDSSTFLNSIMDVIQAEMVLADDQVYLFDQKFTVPNDERIYIALGVLSAKPFGVSRSYDGSGLGLGEIVSVNMQATLSIDIMSRSEDALVRKEEVILAMMSTRSQQAQEALGYMLARLPSSFVNISEIDGAAIPYRFNISVNVQYFVKKTQSVDYYDDFTDAITVEP